MQSPKTTDGKNPKKKVVLDVSPTPSEVKLRKSLRLVPSLTKKSKRTRWVTRAMAEEFGRRDVLFTTFKDALLFCVFVIAVTMCTFGRWTSSMFYITQALKGEFLELEFETADHTEITFYGIQSAPDFWAYMGHVLSDRIYIARSQNPYGVRPPTEEDHRILLENKLLGVPRLRQVKVRNNSCTVHRYFRKIASSCYGLSSDENESKDSFGPGTGTAWVYNSPSKTGSITYDGDISTYGAGGFYQDLGTKADETRAILEHLKQNLWITRGTRAIFLDFSMYNANLNLFCICKFVFEFPPTGGIIPAHWIQAVHLLPFVDTWDYISFAAECVMYLICAYFLVEEIREIVYFKFRYFLQFWTYIDWINITTTVGHLILAHFLMPDPYKAMETIRKHPEKHGNLEKFGALKYIQNNFSATLVCFAYIKLFKYINFNKTMGQLNNTLKRCAFDIFGFSVMFFIIFFAYAELGYMVFGTQVEDFKSFGIAMFTLLRTILGDFDYEAIERANKILAPIYFLTYIFLVFFVLLNMFLAIINDTYADVKTEISIAPDEMQMTEFLKTGCYNILRSCGYKIKFKKEEPEVNELHEQIREALKKCGFSPLEIEMFFARFNVNPLAEVGNYDVKKIVKQLEGQAPVNEKLNEDTTRLQVDDFMKQQERFEQIESAIDVLWIKIDNLIRKLETVEAVRRSTEN